MYQTSNSTRLAVKLLHVLTVQLRMEDLDVSRRIQVDMLAQVDLGKAALPQQAHQAVAAQPLSNAICHGSLLWFTDQFSVWKDDPSHWRKLWEARQACI